MNPYADGREQMEQEPILSRPLNGGVQKVFAFPNGYGASVIRHRYSFGFNDSLWELAVIEIRSRDPLRWNLTYETPVTNDVIGDLTDADVARHLIQIAALPARVPA